MNIAFISFSFFIQNSQVWFINTIEKEPRIRVLYERNFWRWKLNTEEFFFKYKKIGLMCMLCSQFENIKVTQAWRIPQFLYDKKEQEAYGPHCSPVY